MTADPTALAALVRESIPRARGIVAAVSGGGDSVALLRLLHSLGGERSWRLSVAHLDHGTRGDEGHADASFVAALAESLDLPIDAGRWAPTREGHFEADARRARYAWLVQVARDRGAAFVAVGHTRDDQAETILHRILRGTGPRGLAGMAPRRRLAEGIALARPLLGAGRADLRLYLATIGQSFREDSSNADPRRTRNRLRSDLLPKLASEYNPNVVEALDRLGRFAREDLSRRGRRVAVIARASVVSADASGIVLRREPLMGLSPALRAEVVRLLWRRAGWPEGAMTAARWLRLANATEKRFAAGSGIEAVISAETMALAPLSRTDGIEPVPPARLTVPGRLDDRGLVATLDPDAPHDEEIDLDRVAFWSDVDSPRFLRVAAPEPGDRFDPLGLGGHSQGLNDFFRGRGVAKPDRRRISVVSDREGIVWVVGHRIAHRVRVTGATTRRLRLSAGVGCD